MIEAAVIWTPSLESLGKDCTAWAVKTVVRAQLSMRRLAVRIEQWMKSNAPWRDRTGRARAQLRSYAEFAAGTIVVYIVHGVSYGMILESIEAGAYAIIKPALDYWTPRVFDELKAGMR